MTATLRAPIWARGAALALIVAAATGGARSQGIIHTTPGSPIYYAAGFIGSSDIDINGDGVTDFVLLSEAGDVLLAPQGNNRLIAIPEPPPDLGSFVAALDQGFPIGSSLDPVYQWYGRQTDQFGAAAIGAQEGIDNQISVLGYFAGRTAFAGFDLYYDGADHYGWIQIANPLPVVSGQIVDWAYQTSPNTPILAGQGAVPEPGVAVLLLLGLAAICWSAQTRRIGQRPPC
jgi:hypothetical protein